TPLMCGIIAILRRPSRRPPPAGAELTARLRAAVAAAGSISTLAEAAAALEVVEEALRGGAGIKALLREHDLVPALEAGLGLVDEAVRRHEAQLDAGALVASTEELEVLNATLGRVKDASWAIGHDRIPAARAVASLAWPDAGDATVEAYASIHAALSGLDRLEVRGRDSAGLHVLVTGHGLDLDADPVRSLLAARTADPLFTSMAVRVPGGHLAFVYKAAAEIGELGDNTRALRTALGADPLLQMALAAGTARATVLGHTRWASVGIISQANAHPLNHEEEDDSGGPYVAAALNGDVDNYADLIASAGLCIPAAFTTDAKVIPALVSRRLREGAPSAAEAFRATVATFDGSTAVAAVTADAPGQLLLALRGSGQALYVGLGEDSFVVASEPYGLVEETGRYLRMDGETPPPVGGPAGQVVVLDGTRAGALEGVTRLAYDGTPLPVAPDEVRTAEITTRDIDRAGFPHYLLKEVTQSPSSFRKTLRGKIVAGPGGGGNADLTVSLGDETLPPALRARLREGAVRRIRVIGQGTAVVAGHSLATALTEWLAGAGTTVEALPATELSGFRLDDDMSDTLVVAISQSGTTTDTNRTVDLVRSRGATVVAIVNRRDSDLVQRADGVLYTSDGRDVEMAVPSTKAFYAQVAAGFLLALAIAAEAGCADRRRTSELLAALRALPAAMEAVLARRDTIAAAAARHAPSRRHWAVVGNGPNRVAAAEVRIKLSELCYKSIAHDATEDKKHIDLSAEPMIVVCAAGLTGPTADDVAKEVAIYRAHKAVPIVIANEGARYPAAQEVLEVPPAHPMVAFVLSAMAGHLFGYEAALAIDASARPLREARAGVESAVSSAGEGADLLHVLAPRLEGPAVRFLEGLRAGAYDGSLEAATAVRVTSLLRFAREQAPLEAYELECGKVGTPSVVIQDLTDALTRAIEELTRPVDAIKHQAKTVTVGISRSEEALFRVPLVGELLAAGAGRDRLGYRALRTLAALDEAVAEVTGYTRYRIEGSVGDGTATIHVVDRGGVALDIPSRVDGNPQLLGTKHRAATEREVTVARGRRDGRTFVLVPETKDTQVVGMTLLHSRFHDRLPPAGAQRVLQGYRDRYDALVDTVTETEANFDEEVMGRVDLVDLLTQPVHVLADRWRE
ncbi:MAG: SIS domain-containing protein, partial [Acidimicrobiales bacterium]